MKVEILSVTPSRKPSALANVKIRLTCDEGYCIDIDDIRVLRNNRNELWTALPTYSVAEGRGYRYEKTVDVSRGLFRQVDDAVLDAYRAWSEPSGPKGDAR
ncbi:MAG: hypothetical protein ABSE45_13420 [Candidatus Acidiferrales bacterium]